MCELSEDETVVCTTSHHSIVGYIQLSTQDYYTLDLLKLFRDNYTNHLI